MRVVLQRVMRAQVRVDGRVTGSVERGYVLLAAFSAADDTESLTWMADKIVSLRLFPDEPTVRTVGDADDDRAVGDTAPATGGTVPGDNATVDTGAVRPSSFSRDIREIGGDILVVSQFTLYGDTRKGRRPSFIGAAPPERAVALYEAFVELLRERGPARVATGEFGAMMQLELVNDGPVTLILDRTPRTA